MKPEDPRGLGTDANIGMDVLSGGTARPQLRGLLSQRISATGNQTFSFFSPLTSPKIEFSHVSSKIKFQNNM